MRQHGLRAAPEHVQRGGVSGKFVRVNQAAAGLVEGVGGQAIVHIKFSGGVHGGAVAADQALYFFLGGLGTGDGVGARQTRKILAETVSGDESMEIVHGAKIVGVVVPTAHVWTDRWEAFTLTEWF